MRPGMNGRRPRNRNNRKSHIPNRNQVYESSGPENKVRGTAQQIFEKYQTLARDALSSGNLVQAEAFFQHGEHYLRLHNIAVEAAVEAQERRQQQQQDRRDTRSDGDKSGDRQNDRQNDRQGERQNDRRRDRRDRKDRPGFEARDRGFDGDDQTGRDAEAATPSNPQASVDPSEMDQPDLGQMPAFLNDKLPMPATSAAAGEASPAAGSVGEDAKPAPKRRGRPPKAKAAEGEVGEDKPAPKRRGRPPKAKAADGDGAADGSGSGAGSGERAGTADGSGGDFSDAA